MQFTREECFRYSDTLATSGLERVPCVGMCHTSCQGVGGGGEPGNEARPDHMHSCQVLDTWFNRNGAPSLRAVVCIAEGTTDIPDGCRGH